MDPFWLDTSDGELLRTLLGGYPTLADATIRRIQFARNGDGLRMEVDHRDEAGAVRLELSWEGIERLELKLEGEARLYGLDVRRKDGMIHCDLIQGMSLYGTIIAERFDVRLLKADPGEDDLPLEIGYA